MPCAPCQDICGKFPVLTFKAVLSTCLDIADANVQTVSVDGLVDETHELGELAVNLRNN